MVKTTQDVWSEVRTLPGYPVLVQGVEQIMMVGSIRGGGGGGGVTVKRSPSRADAVGKVLGLRLDPSLFHALFSDSEFFTRPPPPGSGRARSVR